ncbi:monovalent cation/H(+) antiporter subunit G [Caulobacter segnis]|uniref:monovalent cation/H(+) antiporter subunit G n=1 Tax=Caulobacter segnis TaxID=88688 RepID=UPI00240EE263|nr:monovalent cation/H(+) antiporter subunit G [Caulobacter segnis]MDG2520706.1 monovalent cation/H(+) antiporter subunit G [Caulobacter segnis]
MIFVAAGLMTLGAAFLLVAAIGVIRLPDPLQRMHSATKAGTVGVALVLGGAMLLDGGLGATAALTIIFLLLTLPIGAQLLGRAAYVSGVKLQGLSQDPLAQELEKIDHPLEPGS